VSWLHAWTIWWSGRRIAENAIVWGVTMGWWSRYGQLAQLAGAFMLVFDIIGPDRLRREGEWFRRTSYYRLLPVIVKWLWAILLLLGIPLMLAILISANVWRANGLIDLFETIYVSIFCFFGVASVLYAFVAITLRLRKRQGTAMVVRIASWLLVLTGTALALLAS